MKNELDYNEGSLIDQFCREEDLYGLEANNRNLISHKRDSDNVLIES
jgi:hypothetical protein